MVTTSHRSRLAELAARSLAVIAANQAPSGAYLAAPNFPVYRYSWLRDGAFIADAVSRARQPDSAVAFFDWCRQIIEQRNDRITQLVDRRQAGEAVELADFLHTRYTVDGDEADEVWWNHQLDGYGAWLWSLGAHAARSRRDGEWRRFTPAVEASGRYLIAFWDHACYDCWEEHADEVHVSTLAALAAGLRVVADWPGVERRLAAEAGDAVESIGRRVRSDGIRDGHLVKWLGGSDLDASLVFCGVPYRLFAPDDSLMVATVSALEEELAHGGVHRHAADVYYGGGEWILLAAALGSHHAALGDLDRAHHQLEWVAAQATTDGDLPEQVSSHLLHPEGHAEWQTRWGPIACPLLWSHAMFLNLHAELYGAT